MLLKTIMFRHNGKTLMLIPAKLKEKSPIPKINLPSRVSNELTLAPRSRDDIPIEKVENKKEVVKNEEAVQPKSLPKSISD
ncbi:hypothetical protein L484_004539 [Morus notabilis]|uniref:Uncharacterized protein n=1 Tax=Morus notabilis TaxID=981085 RepID=W9RUZ1_9ROSA|nr:hypothetical protein L484_004539 [Morus notabilis]